MRRVQSLLIAVALFVLAWLPAPAEAAGWDPFPWGQCTFWAAQMRPDLIGSVWVNLFEGDNQTTNGAVFFRATRGEVLPLWCSWAALAVLCMICLYMLARKIRGMEVVR